MTGLKITDLERGQCKFPITPFEATTHFFCGEPVEYEKCPYCPTHAAKCFDRRSDEVKRARAQQLERMRAAKKVAWQDHKNGRITPTDRPFRDELHGRDS